MTKCGNCRAEGHNIRTCHNIDMRHSPNPPVQAAVPVPADARKIVLTNLAEELYRHICISNWDISIITSDITRGVIQLMIAELTQHIVRLTRHEYRESFYIETRIIQLLRIRGELRDQISRYFTESICQEHDRLNNIDRARFVSGVAFMIPYNINPAVREEVQQVFVPHKPQFSEIIICPDISAKSEDYICGVCAEEYTQTTIPTLGCSHTLCCDCIIGQIKARDKSCVKCPFCREEIATISVQDQEIRNTISGFIATEILQH